VSIALLANEQDEIDYEIYSQDAEQEIVHCQGRAVWSGEPAPAKVDLDQLKREMGEGPEEPNRIYAACARMGLVYGPSLQAITGIHCGSGQVLAHLRLPKTAEEGSGEYVLHPSLMDGALQACVGLMEGSTERSHPTRLPFALESLRIVSPCTPEMAAWVRYAAGSRAGDKVVKLDIDLCDERGNVCVQMRGVSWHPASLDIVETVLDQAASARVSGASKQITVVPPLRKEIIFIPFTQAMPVPVEREKPAAISLAAPSTLVSPAPVCSANNGGQPSAGRAPITLSNKTVGVGVEGSVAGGVSCVRLYDDGQGIFSIEIAGSVSSHTPVKGMLASLQQALDRVRREASIKVLMLRGLERGFEVWGREEYNEAVERKFYQGLVSFPYPVIAVLQGDAMGASMLAAAMCDFMVCNEDANYGYTDGHTHWYPTTAEAMLMGERFGAVQAQDLLYVARVLTGKQLRTKGWTCPMVSGMRVEAYAEELASTLATKSQEALGLLKQHLTRQLVGLVKELTRVEVGGAGTEESSDAGAIASPAEHIHVEIPVENVLVIKICAGNKKVGGKELVADLGRMFAKIQPVGCYKAIVLVSEFPNFLPGTEPGMSEEGVLDIQRLIVELEIPVVAAVEGNAKGQAWLISQMCDASVYSQTGVYCAARMGAGPVVAQTATALFTHRLGNSAGKEILLSGGNYSGADLQQRVGGLMVTEQDQVLPTAISVAACWAKLPRATLAAWKKYTATILQEKIGRLPAGGGWEEKEETAKRLVSRETLIPLQSKVVTASVHPEGIVVVKMEDRQAKNMFSEAFLEGVREVFAHIEQTPAYKVVVLTGYDSYFACGGTKEGLLAIQAGKAKFTDSKIFQVAVDCKLPVIAAVQGHGIGAGWSLGMFADVVLLSEESQYVSPYMNYGFTPGAGATYILAEKMGQDLARESLLTGQSYAGRELKQRGLLLRVLPRVEVYGAAMVLARQIAQSSGGRLRGLKQQWTGYVHQELEQTYRCELAMHEKTFVGRSDTLAQIQKNFRQEIEVSPANVAQAQEIEVSPANVAQAQVAAAVHPSVDRDVLSAVTASLKTLLANELQMRESDVDENVQFVDLGLDSISGVTWVRKINEKYHTTIKAAKLYSHPTLSQLGGYVKEEAEKHGTLTRPDAPAAVESPSLQPKRGMKVAAEKLTSRRSRTAARLSSAPAVRPTPAIAVIGMAGQFPQAKNLEEFWQNIAQGRNCITQVPAGRWDVNAYYRPGAAVAGKTNSQWVGALEEYDRFDPLFFNISPSEAESMDPQQRLFLQACWHSVENAGYDARVLSGSKCGVFVGCTYGDYHLLSREHQLSAQGFTGDATSVLAARISYFLNLQGPCISIDTACSSSLVAIAHACDSLTSGGSDLALAGGVYVMAGPELHIKTAQTGMLSPEGKCFTFDQRADGFVPGEGVGVVMLKRLADAQKDQDIIYGVIQGWGVNQDGKTNGITAPNPESQTRLEQEVYDKYQIDPANIQLIEAHGTGTKLGDPIEVEGLKKAFKKYTQNKEYCALGSVKSNIGHCLTAAGIAGVIKVILVLKHKQLPPTINFEQMNEHIDLKDSPFYVNSRLQEWQPNGGARRQAAISSFGFSGTNAHMVIGEYLQPAEIKLPVSFIATQNMKVAIPLSARTAVQLKQKAGDLLEFIRQEGTPVDLVAMAYTLQVGRAAMEERVGFLVSSVEELAEKLVAYVAGEQGMEDVYQGQVKRSKESMNVISQDDEIRETIVDKWIASGKVSKLLELWVKGLELDWSKLYGEGKPQRMSLPTYPFAKERYWIDAGAEGEVGGKGGRSAVLHPLLQRNTSDLSEQRYSSTFTGEEFFLADHQVGGDGQGGQKVLPGVAYLEMARAAIEHASPIQPKSSILELQNTVWLQPVVVAEHKQVSIALFANENDRVGYEIYSIEAEKETIHCQGQAVFSCQPAPARLDIEQLKGQMEQGRLEPSEVYAAFAKMGLNYGPAHQGILAIYRGEKQVLTQLRLPAIVETSQHEYVLHPSLMDSALQASIGLLVDLNHVPSKPSLPFALESLRIISPCTREMVAWVRYSEGSKSEDKVAKLDIDLCDQEGNVCVQMQGFASRVLQGEIKSTHTRTIRKTTNQLARDKAKFIEGNSPFDSNFYQKLIADVLNREVSVDEAVKLGLGGYAANLNCRIRGLPGNSERISTTSVAESVGAAELSPAFEVAVIPTT
jgi:acyl transferase domain-containing protein/enoyl-CoA hydratase/carnithine racemase/aryl carrier-like protein